MIKLKEKLGVDQALEFSDDWLIDRVREDLTLDLGLIIVVGQNIEDPYCDCLFKTKECLILNPRYVMCK